MIRLIVKEVAEARGFRNAKELADRLGKSYNSIYPIWRGTASRIDLNTLDQLCTILRVQPGLLFEHEPDMAHEPPISSSMQRRARRQATTARSGSRAGKQALTHVGDVVNFSWRAIDLLDR